RARDARSGDRRRHPAPHRNPRWQSGQATRRAAGGIGACDVVGHDLERMNLLNAIVVGLKEIWAHKFRSVLTMLGIILGVSSLVGMSAIVKGMENSMKEAR